MNNMLDVMHKFGISQKMYDEMKEWVDDKVSSVDLPNALDRYVAHNKIKEDFEEEFKEKTPLYHSELWSLCGELINS